MSPRRALAPLLSASGAAVAVTPFAVRGAGEASAAAALPLVALVTIVVPGALLSAVTPMVTKLVLTDLDETGTVVGRLSGIGTTGAIFGTVFTGFVLISRVPVTAILVGLGLLLLLAAVVVEVGVRRRPPVTSLVLVLLGAVGAVLAPGDCDAETKYHCANVHADPAARAVGCSSSTGCGTRSSTSTTRPTWSSPTSRRWRRSSTAPSRTSSRWRRTTSAGAA